MREKIASFLPIDWGFLGFGLIQLAYIEMYKLLNASVDSGRFVLDIYWAFAVLAALAVGLVALFKLEIPRLRRITLVIALLETIHGVLFVVAQATIMPEIPTIVCAVFLGVGCSLGWLLWEDKLANLSSTLVVFYVALCAFVMALFHVATTIFPQVHLVLLICAQLGGFILLVPGYAEGEWKRPSRATAQSPLLKLGEPLPSVTLVAMMFVFAFSYHYAVGAIYSHSSNIMRDIEDLVSVAAVFIILFFMSRCRFAKVLQISIPLIVVSYLLVNFLPAQAQTVCIVLSGSASKFVQLLLIIETIYAAGTFSEKRRWITISLSVGALFLGRLASDLCIYGLQHFSSVISMETASIYVILAALLFAVLTLQSSHTATPQREVAVLPDASTEPYSAADVVAQIVEEYGLTSREAEVLTLLCRCRNQKAIANKLQISSGTTHVHITRIYNKTNVHSQQELLDLIESKMPVQ